MFFAADRVPRRPRTCGRPTASSFPPRRAGSSAAPGWLAIAEGNEHVFPLKYIDTPLGIRHLHVSRRSRGGKNPDCRTNVQRRNRDGEEEGEGQEAQG